MDQSGLLPRRSAHHLLMQITTEGRLMAELIAGGALAQLRLSTVRARSGWPRMRCAGWTGPTGC